MWLDICYSYPFLFLCRGGNNLYFFYFVSYNFQFFYKKTLMLNPSLIKSSITSFFNSKLLVTLTSGSANYIWESTIFLTSHQMTFSLFKLLFKSLSSLIYKLDSSIIFVYNFLFFSNVYFNIRFLSRLRIFSF